MDDVDVFGAAVVVLAGVVVATAVGVTFTASAAVENTTPFWLARTTRG